MPTTEEMTAAVAAARAEATAAAEAAHATALAEATTAATATATTTAQAAERERVAGIYAASFAGYEADRDEAIRSGSTVAAFKAMVVDKEHAKAADRAGKVSADVTVNSTVHAPPKAEPALTGEAAAVQAILSAGALARG